MNEVGHVLAVPGDNTEVMAIDQNIDVIIGRADKQVEILRKVLGIALKRLNPSDWLDQSGKPYLGASGAEKLMPVFGISLKDTSCEKSYYEDDEGAYYVYTHKGTFYWAGGSIEAIGVCSSRDKFFAWDSKEKKYNPLSRVEDPDIKKSSYSNMMMNGVTRLLGIRNLTWDELAQFGIKKDSAQSVQYGGKQTTPDETKLQNEVGQMCLEMAYNDKDKAAAILEELTQFQGKDGKTVAGVKNIRRLTGKRLEITHGKVKNEHTNFKGMMQDVDEGLQGGAQ